jgi:hypothetical protein
MNTLLIILSILALIIAAICLIALCMSEDYLIEREVVINRSNHDVFDYVKITRNHIYFNKWWMNDPNLQVEYKGNDGTVGLIAAWNSEDKGVGAGEQETIRIQDGSVIEYEIRFFKPFESVSYSVINTMPLSTDQTKVKWAFKGKRAFSMRIFHLLLNIKKVLGKDLETSLSNLKNILEKK